MISISELSELKHRCFVVYGFSGNGVRIVPGQVAGIGQAQSGLDPRFVQRYTINEQVFQHNSSLYTSIQRKYMLTVVFVN